MGPEALAQVLRPLQSLFRADEYPRLLVGLEVSDVTQFLFDRRQGVLTVHAQQQQYGNPRYAG